MTRRITIEVEVPEGIDEEALRREARRQIARLILLHTLNLQTRKPSPEDVEKLAEEVKRNAYRREQ